MTSKVDKATRRTGRCPSCKGIWVFRFIGEMGDSTAMIKLWTCCGCGSSVSEQHIAWIK